MTCIRCERLRAEITATWHHNLGKSALDICAILNDKYEGNYFVIDNPHGAMIYREKATPDAEDLEVYFC